MGNMWNKFIKIPGAIEENPKQYHKLSTSSVTAQLQMQLASGFLKSDGQPEGKWHYPEQTLKSKGTFLNYV